MNIAKRAILIILVLFILSSAAFASVTGKCNHANSYHLTDDIIYLSSEESMHYALITPVYHCRDCGVNFKRYGFQEEGYRPHSFQATNEHQGRFHIYTYSCGCGYSYQEVEECSGPPCAVRPFSFD